MNENLDTHSFIIIYPSIQISCQILEVKQWKYGILQHRDSPDAHVCFVFLPANDAQQGRVLLVFEVQRYIVHSFHCWNRTKTFWCYRMKCLNVAKIQCIELRWIVQSKMKLLFSFTHTDVIHPCAFVYAMDVNCSSYQDSSEYLYLCSKEENVIRV